MRPNILVWILFFILFVYTVIFYFVLFSVYYLFNTKTWSQTFKIYLDLLEDEYTELKNYGGKK